MPKKVVEVNKVLLFLLSIALQLLIFLLVLALIVFFAYLLGREYLLGDSISGNDTFSFYTIVDWLSKFYPKIPFWFPLEGGGVSFTGYQWFSAYVINFISHTFPINNVQAFRLLGFLGVPLTGVGIFVFCWTRLREIKSIFIRQLIGMVATMLFITAPVSWVWLYRWGFYAEQASIIFIPWILLFMDLFLEKLFNGKDDFYYRLSFLSVIILGVLGFMTHFYIVVTTITIFTTLFIVRFVFHSGSKRELVKRIFLPLIFFTVLYSCAFASRYYSYYHYNSSVAFGGLRGGTNVAANRQGTAESLLTPRMMLSLDDVSSPNLPLARDVIVDMRFPFYVWLLLIPAFIFSWFNSKKIFAFTIIAIIGFITNTNVDAYIFFSRFPIISYIPIINQIPIGFLGRLFFVTGRIIIPISAAYGAFVIWEIAARHIDSYLNSKRSIGYFVFSKISTLLIAFLGIFTFGFLVFNFYNLPYPKNIVNIGAWVSGRHIYLSDIWDNGSQKIGNTDPYNIVNANKPTDLYTQLKPKNWPKPEISGSISHEIKGTKDFFAGLPESSYYRYDISGYSARVIESTPLVNNNSQIQLYINNLSLLFNLSNYLSQIMYTIMPSFQTPGVLTEVAKWFGLNYVYLSGTPLEPHDYWKADPNWTKITGSNDGGWRQFNLKTEVVSWDSRPKILVISDNSKDFYDAAFRFFTRGGLRYEQAIPVQGKKNIDEYSLEDLSKYDAIFMFAYGYKNRSHAYSLMEKYIKNGGKLIFDTGWQYYVPDYQLGKTPSFMPFETLTWKNLSRNTTFSIDDTSLSSKIEVSKMGDLTYAESSWGVSAPSNLRSWARTLVSADSTPLVVSGNYGKGTITWIGFNIIPHSEAKKSLEEVKLFNELISNNLGDGNSLTSYEFKINRPYPDRIIFSPVERLNTLSHIYFREAYFPDWHARLESGGKVLNLPISRAGAGFMLIDIPNVKIGDKIVLEIKPSIGQYIANILTILSISTLVVYLLIPGIFRNVKISWIKIPKFNYKIINSKNEDQDY